MVRKSGSKSMKNKCAPGRVSKGDVKWTCYSKESLIKMAKSYNVTIGNGGGSGKNGKNGKNGKKGVGVKGASGLVNNMLTMVEGNEGSRGRMGGKRIAYVGKSKKQIWDQLSDRLFYQCKGDEMCWADQGFVKKLGDKEIDSKTFKPKMPETWKSNPNEWLNTSNITNVMRQYEDAHDDFLYLGTVPRDCPMGVSCHLSNIDMTKLYKKHGVRKVGLIYNLDLHNQPGSHWVAVYMNLSGGGKKGGKTGTVTYFDSYADKPPKLIHDFIKRCIIQMKGIGVDLKYQVNERRHQYGGSECGVYSCYYLIQSLDGKTLKQFSARRVADRKMNQMRKQLFVAQ